MLVACVYVATAARDVVVGDTGDFLTTAATLGVAHPPGYPLLVLLGHAFSLLPVGPLPFRINLVAAISDAIAVGLAFSIARRLGAPRLPAVVAALALAFNPLFWEWSLAIEAFPLNDCIATLLIYLLVRWDGEPERRVFLAGAALCGGLGAANHLTIIFLIPLVLTVMWHRRAAIDARTVVFCVGAIFVGMLPYLYIPWAAARDPYLNWGNVTSAHDLLQHFLRSDYGTGRLVATGGPSGSPIDRLEGLGTSFTILESILIVVGAIEAYRIKWYFWGSLLSFAIAGPAFVAYANMDVSNPPLLWALGRFFLMPHVIAAPFAAFGAIAIEEAIASQVPRAKQRVVETAVVAVAAVAFLVSAALRYRSVDLSGDHLAHTFVQDALATLQPNTVLLARGDEVVFPAAYVQAVDRARPDVTLIATGMLGFQWYIPQLRRRDPRLRIPYDRYDPRNASATLRALIEANPDRPFALIGSATDNSLNGPYWLYRRGVVEDVEPMSKDVGLDAAAHENDRLLRAYHLPNPGAVRRNTFEISYLDKYKRAPASLGDQFTLAHLDRQAEDWYRRALAIDPLDAGVRAKLAKVSARISP
ncbi:MAG TPA: DUF2723 domain-containing protein [Gemmatimonadaceae bacterium]|nr:DUF2723 domain-containing protein [Gemmatimonadaceae bacterium]